MCKRRNSKWMVMTGVGVLVIMYLVLPFVMGMYGVGDRRGPKVYPRWYHQELFKLGWEAGNHSEKKPRIPIDGWKTVRPWFYGLEGDDR